MANSTEPYRGQKIDVYRPHELSALLYSCPALNIYNVRNRVELERAVDIKLNEAVQGIKAPSFDTGEMPIAEFNRRYSEVADYFSDRLPAVYRAILNRGCTVTELVPRGTMTNEAWVVLEMVVDDKVYYIGPNYQLIIGSSMKCG